MFVCTLHELFLNFMTKDMADKNGDHDVSAQETEELERALAEAYKDVRTARDTLDKLLKGAINMDELGEEATRQVAEVLASNLQGNRLMST